MRSQVQRRHQVRSPRPTAGLWRISLSTSGEAEEAVAELFEQAFSARPVSYIDAKTGATLVSVYVPRPPGRSDARQRRLAAGLERIKASGLALGAGRLKCERVRKADWAESWKRHFHPIEVGLRLLVKPSWSRRRARRGQAVVVLDPGLSFGTGQHPTTHFCLRELARRRRAGERQSLLDVGTGSGILAIAAARLGYKPVTAFDFDPDAVRVARTNARANGVARQIRFSQRDLTERGGAVGRRYSVVCANLTADLLLSQRDRLLEWLAPGSRLVLAGILEEEFETVRRAYQAAGWRLTASRTQNEWRSGSFSAVAFT